MHPRPCHIQLSLPLPRADYRVFVTAVRLLRRVMGRKAPDALALIQSNLRDRDATGLADDYLDSIRWPCSAGRVVSLRRARRSVRITVAAPVPKKTPCLSVGRNRPPADPSRN